MGQQGTGQQGAGVASSKDASSAWAAGSPPSSNQGSMPSWQGTESHTGRQHATTSALEATLPGGRQAPASTPSASTALSSTAVLDPPTQRTGSQRHRAPSTSTILPAQDAQGSSASQASSCSTQNASSSSQAISSRATSTSRQPTPFVVPFYKAWDRWGALSNFSPHSILLPHHHTSELPQEPVCEALVLASSAEGPPHQPEPDSPAHLDRELRCVRM